MKNIYIAVVLLLLSSYSFAANLLNSTANAARNVVDSTVGAIKGGARPSDRPTVVVEHTQETKEITVDKDHPHMRKVTKTYKQVKRIN